MWAFHERDTLAGVWLKIIDRQRNDWPVVFRRFLQENQRLAPARELPTGHLALADAACKGRSASNASSVRLPTTDHLPEIFLRA